MMSVAELEPTLHRWRRASTLWLLLTLLLAAATACGSSSTQVAVAERTPALGAATPTAIDPTPAAAEVDDEATQTPVPTATTSPTATPTPHPVLAADTDLPPAPIGFDALAPVATAGPQPVAMRIESLNVDDAEIIAVGVNEDQTFEVPPADQVGWYEFGPTPGEAGSSVLAAHIAYNGVDGVFRYLADVEVGSIVEIDFDDGSSQRYRIETVTDYLKEELPASLFARTGDAQLALITCGGSFNRQLSSYESNTVAVAVPI